MANNRMYLKCRACPDAEPQMIAKYYPQTGWYIWTVDVIEEFFNRHHHVSQWGCGFDLSFEIEPDFPITTAPPLPSKTHH